MSKKYTQFPEHLRDDIESAECDLSHWYQHYSGEAAYETQRIEELVQGAKVRFKKGTVIRSGIIEQVTHDTVGGLWFVIRLNGRLAESVEAYPRDIISFEGTAP